MTMTVFGSFEGGEARRPTRAARGTVASPGMIDDYAEL